eukprot:TRINITY_DN6090_c0_g2_i1.p1 TRINITY_DN6090_c0_g2~~TRINITY_DN6090_c0_g2_i1.p1  ORF type:complete len:187 (-),score=46.30 TRINITY_DN6090_c0_g2_i1:62-622(-)
MKTSLALALAAFSASTCGGFVLRRSHSKQDPDTSCGKGFESLVPGSKDYLATAREKLWTHPGQTGNEDTFEQELQCWYANMLTNKCGALPSKYDARNKDLSAMCTGVGQDDLQVWKMFDDKEKAYFRENFPAEALGETPEDTTHYKQSMKTALELNKREVMCMTLFLIDDECGSTGLTHIRVHMDG